MSIKMYGLIPRKPEMSTDEFHDYYRHPHGTMGRNMTTMRGYVQNHQIQTSRLGADQNRFDAVAEIWLDNEADALAFREEPVLVKYLLEDEPKFVDMAKLTFLAAQAEVVQSGPSTGAALHPADAMWSPATRPLTVKLLQFIELDGNPDWARDDDGELASRLQVFRHTRAVPLRAVHRDAPTFLGLRELWWPTRTHFHQAVDADRAAFEALLDHAGKATTMLVQAERFI